MNKVRNSGMKHKILFKSSIFISAIYFMPYICFAAQETEDVFASVVISPIFEIELDNNFLDFGVVEPGESVKLKEATYYNKIKCISNKGIEYYVKLGIIDEIIGPKGSTIHPSSFKWRVHSTTGSGEALSNWQEFADKPVLVYTSGIDDKTGNEVIIRFQYKLDLPPQAMGGSYSLKVAYVLTEER